MLAVEREGQQELNPIREYGLHNWDLNYHQNDVTHQAYRIIKAATLLKIMI